MGQLWATSVPGDSRRAWTLAITEGEYPPGGTAVRLVHIADSARLAVATDRPCTTRRMSCSVPAKDPLAVPRLMARDNAEREMGQARTSAML